MRERANLGDGRCGLTLSAHVCGRKRERESDDRAS
jgi:hypothetical protein